MRFDELFDDRQSQAEAVVHPRRRGVGLAERLEDRRQEVARDARTRVGDDNLARVAAAADADVDGAALRRELDGVGQQVPQHLLQA